MKTISRSKRERLPKHERDIQAEILSRLKLLGGRWFKIQRTNDNGAPDIIGWYQGRSFAIELKRPGEKPRPLQEMVLADIKHHGKENVVVGVCDSLTDVLQLIANAERR
jgi:hypothetical protein